MLRPHPVSRSWILRSSLWDRGRCLPSSCDTCADTRTGLRKGT